MAKTKLEWDRDENALLCPRCGELTSFYVLRGSLECTFCQHRTLLKTLFKALKEENPLK